MQSSSGSNSVAPPMRPARSERRPVTGGTSPSSDNEYRPPSHLGGMPSSMPSTIPMAVPRLSGQSMSTQHTSESSGDGIRRRNSVAVGSGPPPTSPMKRPPRKLSFSSSMLGFGRRTRTKIDAKIEGRRVILGVSASYCIKSLFLYNRNNRQLAV